MPLSEWTRLYSETMQSPMDHDLYARRDFFDLAVLSGESSILDSLEKHIQHEMQDHSTTIALLANDTLINLPPLTFFAASCSRWMASSAIVSTSAPP